MLAPTASKAHRCASRKPRSRSVWRLIDGSNASFGLPCAVEEQQVLAAAVAARLPKAGVCWVGERLHVARQLGKVMSPLGRRLAVPGSMP